MKIDDYKYWANAHKEDYLLRYNYANLDLDGLKLKTKYTQNCCNLKCAFFNKSLIFCLLENQRKVIPQGRITLC